MQEMTYDIIIVGAGPVGLTIANFAGLHGLKILVLERMAELIDYPRGVGMDDECLRAFQGIGLADRIVPHTTPHQWMQFQTAHRKTFASIEPREEPFGWPKRNAFIQPLTDRILLDGLERFQNADIRFNVEMQSFEDLGTGGVRVDCIDAAGTAQSFRASFLVGADGGKSAVRKGLDIPFEGKTEPTHWLVVDIRNDPSGVPNAVLICDPARPYVSISLPHGIRRFEFMVMPGESEADLNTPAGIERLLSKFLPDPKAAQLIRARIYTHNSRLARHLVKGRVALAGDAAHVMPVWQGQGYNSGIRDANNLAWKLVAMCKGVSSPALLKTYHDERHEHARAMISLSTLVGRIFSPTQRWLATLRDISFSLLNVIPPVRDYVLQMRFKPMPRYTSGAVVTVPVDPAVKASPVGQLFIQPLAQEIEGAPVRLDDIIGPWFCLIALASDPSVYLDDEARQIWQKIGGKTLVAVPQTQLADPGIDTGSETQVIGDTTQAIREWFKGRTHSVVILRPDRFVAATCAPQAISETIKSLGKAIALAS